MSRTAGDPGAKFRRTCDVTRVQSRGLEARAAHSANREGIAALEYRERVARFEEAASDAYANVSTDAVGDTFRRAASPYGDGNEDDGDGGANANALSPPPPPAAALDADQELTRLLNALRDSIELENGNGPWMGETPPRADIEAAVETEREMVWQSMWTYVLFAVVLSGFPNVAIPALELIVYVCVGFEMVVRVKSYIAVVNARAQRLPSKRAAARPLLLTYSMISVLAVVFLSYTLVSTIVARVTPVLSEYRIEPSFLVRLPIIPAIIYGIRNGRTARFAVELVREL